MHPNRTFRSNDHAKDITFARERGFGTLMVPGESLPFVAHVPFLLAEDGKTADLHLVRSNPIARLDGPTHPATIAVSGPDSYISPDWYELEDQVPTWNYVAIHLTGQLEMLPQSMLLDVLNRESAFFESRLAPKPAWTTEKMSPEILDRMMRMIVPFRLTVDAIDATWKLGQNKPDSARLAAADAAGCADIGTDISKLAQFMKAPPKL